MTYLADARIVLTAAESSHIRTTLGALAYDPPAARATSARCASLPTPRFPTGSSTRSIARRRRPPMRTARSRSTTADRRRRKGQPEVRGNRPLVQGRRVERERAGRVEHAGRRAVLDCARRPRAVNNLTPHKATARDYTGLSLRSNSIYIENAAQAHMPEGDTSPFALLLLGVRSEAGGGPYTRLADARRAAAAVAGRYRATMASTTSSACRTGGAGRATPRDNTDLSAVLSGRSMRRA